MIEKKINKFADINSYSVNKLEHQSKINKTILIELINIIKYRFYAENGFFSSLKNLRKSLNYKINSLESQCSSRYSSVINNNFKDSINSIDFNEMELEEKIIYYIGKYDLENLLIQESNKIIDEIVLNLKNHFIKKFPEEENFKISNFGKDLKNKLIKYSSKENYKDLTHDLRSIKGPTYRNFKEEKKVIQPAMKYNHYQKSIKQEIKFYEVFDFEKSKKKNVNISNNNFFNDVKNKKNMIEKEIINNIDNKPKGRMDKDKILRDMLDNILLEN